MMLGTQVISARVDASVAQVIAHEAEQNGRSMAEQASRMIQECLQHRREDAEGRSILKEAQRIRSENLEAELRRQGYRKVHAMDGAAWFEPGVSALRWIFPREELDELMQLAGKAGAEATKGRTN
jgi:hypothetical protein